MASETTFVIAGGGLAGAKAAETLRGEGFDGRIVLVSAEEALPYERPPLSKDYLRGETERSAFTVHDEAWYESNAVELLRGRTATALEPAEDTIVLDGGERLRYDRLLLATGAEPRRLPVPGADLDGVHYFRTTEDADTLRGRIGGGARLVVIGAGWIGAEIAASARMMGADVTVVEPLSVPLERVLGPEAGAIYRDVHAAHGVTLRLGTGVEALEGGSAVERVRTSDGERIDCDLVVVGIGVAPRVELARDAGLDVGDGVLVDAQLRTSAPNVFAAGDIAAAEHPFYGERLRVEHWANALEQGPAAARSMLGTGAPYERLPYFYSDQYDVGMEYTGYAPSWDQVVLRGDPAAPEVIAFWLKDGRVLAGMNVNVWDVTEPIERLIRSRAVVDPERLANPEVPLDEVAQAASSGRSSSA
jgi:3-phenylpropionate/trans-cinnamate dioxygenase ferredoxin reductase component